MFEALSECVTRLSLTKKFVDRWSQFNLQKHGRQNKTNSAQVSLTRLGYLDVAIAKKFAKLACHLVL